MLQRRPAQLERGLEFAASLPVGPERDELEAELLLALANILQTTTSMSSAEAAAVLDRAVPICRRLARTPLEAHAQEEGRRPHGADYGAGGSGECPKIRLHAVFKLGDDAVCEFLHRIAGRGLAREVRYGFPVRC